MISTTHHMKGSSSEAREDADQHEFETVTKKSGGLRVELR
ncbi:hypothetical protein EV12_1308 [Prochlorococcus sp. MIT 0701]|nr:hypothetical protein EV12_1308 [Prochlorococcus sp. MIT 0701]